MYLVICVTIVAVCRVNDGSSIGNDGVDSNDDDNDIVNVLNATAAKSIINDDSAILTTLNMLLFLSLSLSLTIVLLLLLLLVLLALLC